MEKQLIIRGVTADQLRDAAAEVGVLLRYITPKGRGWQLTLKPDVQRRPSKHGYGRILPETRYQRRGVYKGQRIDAVCWHGHRDFMRAIFQMNPDAVIISSWARYNGSVDFEEKLQETGRRNLGSVVCPMYAQEACFC